MTITYTVHDRAGVQGNDIRITVRSDGGPDDRAVYQRLCLLIAGATLPFYVASDGITVESITAPEAA